MLLQPLSRVLSATFSLPFCLCLPVPCSRLCNRPRVGSGSGVGRANGGMSRWPLLLGLALLLSFYCSLLVPPSLAALKDANEHFPGVSLMLDTPPLPRLSLAITNNNTAYDYDKCTATFHLSELHYLPWVPLYHQQRLNIHTCPRQCGRAARAAATISPDTLPTSINTSYSPFVFGSFPYHAYSSICLAAIHSGLIDEEQGGALFVDPFWSDEWQSTGGDDVVDHSSLSSLFPFNSSSASFSLGIQTYPVPAEWLSPTLVVPAPLSSSWSVRPRGVVAVQRQTAPFSPRAGHLHATVYPLLAWRTRWTPDFSRYSGDPLYGSFLYNPLALHFIIGGYNESSYMNDVRRASRTSSTTLRWVVSPLTDSLIEWCVCVLPHVCVCSVQVWLYHAATYPQPGLNLNSINGNWTRLPDAPFTPRADMLFHFIIHPSPPPLEMVPKPADSIVLLVVGGQTSHACNQRMLGTCSDEIWQLTIKPVEGGASNFSSTPLGLGFTFTWSDSPVSIMPFQPRCGASAIVDRRLITPLQSRIVGIVGGQLSYNASAAGNEDCAAQVETVRSAWYTQWPTLSSSWQRGRDTPFTPRRSMAVEDALVSEDGHYSAPDGDEDLEGVPAPFDKTVSLAGGIRYLSHRFDAASSSAIMTRAEMYADVWTCTLVTPEWRKNNRSDIDCDWHYSYPIANLSRDGDSISTAAPSSSLPVATAHAASALYPAGQNFFDVRIGGAYSQQSFEQFTTLRNPFFDDNNSGGSKVRWDSDTNVSTIFQPVIVHTESDPTINDVMVSRYGLPLSVVVDETELNEPLSSFVRGGDLIMTTTSPMRVTSIKPQYTTVFRQPSQMPSLSPYSSSLSSTRPSPSPSPYWPFVSHPSPNSTRHLFDFSNRRVGHAMSSTWDMQIVSGGRSEGRYTSDWIRYANSQCLFPEDPSYYDALGRVVTYSYNENSVTNGDLTAPGSYYEWHLSDDRRSIIVNTRFPHWVANFHSGTQIEVACAAGYHFSPPVDGDSATFLCSANGMWIDTQLLGVRKCVADRADCAYPFIDDGRQHCVAPLPQVRRVRIAFTDWRQEQFARNIGLGVVATPLPFDRQRDIVRSTQLVVDGQWLTYPLSVSVGSEPCRAPQLRNATVFCSDPQDNSTCAAYGTGISCIMPSVAGNQSVTISSGRRRFPILSIRQREVEVWRTVLVHSGYQSQVDVLPPFVSYMESPYCEQPLNRSNALEKCVFPAHGQLQITWCATSYLARFFGRTRQSTLLGSVDIESHCRAHSDHHPFGLERCSLIPVDQCGEPVLCKTCTLPPSVFNNTVSEEVLYIQQMGNSNLGQVTNPAAKPSISFRPCPVNTYTDYSAKVWEVERRCVPCRAGSSTQGQVGQQTCALCDAGWYRSESMAECMPCPANSVAPSSGSSACQLCEGNKWRRGSAAAECSECDAGQYRVVGRSSSNSSSFNPQTQQQQCYPCPSGATCNTGNNSVEARDGWYLIIDQEKGTLSSVQCAGTACVGSTTNAAGTGREAGTPWVRRSASPHSQRIDASGLLVYNYCGDNRQPAASYVDSEADAAWDEELGWDEDSGEQLNVLCSACLSGFTEVQGVCIPCSSVQWGHLVLFFLLLFLFVYACHRLWSVGLASSGRLGILVYFVQMSLLFLANEVPPVLLPSIANIDLSGGTSSINNRNGVALLSLSVCVVPLSDYGKVAVRLLSPVVVLLLLAALLATHLAVRALINATHVDSDNDVAVHAGQQRHNVCLKVYHSLLPAARWMDGDTYTRSLSFLSRSSSLPSSSVLSRYWRTCFPSSRLRLTLTESLSPVELSPTLESDKRFSWQKQQQYQFSEPLFSAEDRKEQFEDDVIDKQQRPHEEKVLSEPVSESAASASASSSLAAEAEAEAAMDASAPLSLLPPSGDTVPSVLLLYKQSLIRLLLFSYNAVTSVTFTFFYTQDLEVLGRRLHEYPSISVNDALYKGLIPLMVLMLMAAVLGGPAVLLCYLSRLRKRMAFITATDPATARAAMGSKHDLMYERQMLSVSPAFALLLIYRPSCWYFTVVMLLRRLLLIVVLIFTSSGSAYVWLTVINFGYLYFHSLLSPYRLEQDNVLEAITLLALALQTSLLSAYPDANQQTLEVRWMLWLLLIAPFVLLLVDKVWRWRRERRTAAAELSASK